MSNSIYVIRLITAACLCLTPIAVNGYGLNDVYITNGGGLSEKELKADEDDSLVPKGWSCDPIFHAEKIVDWRYRSKDELAMALLEFRGCKWQEISEQVRDAFINAYVIFDYNFSLTFFEDDRKARFKSMISIENSEKIGRDKRDLIITSVKISYTFDSDKKRYEEKLLKEQAEAEAAKNKAIEEESRKQAERAAEEAEKAKRERALDLRIAGLKNGTIKIVNFEDAVLFHNSRKLDQLMRSPLLKPNNETYSGSVFVEGDEGNDFIRVKSLGLQMNNNLSGVQLVANYAILRFTEKTINYSVNDLRIGGEVTVIGQYVRNVNNGVIMPVLDVLYIGD